MAWCRRDRNQHCMLQRASARQTRKKGAPHKSEALSATNQTVLSPIVPRTVRHNCVKAVSLNGIHAKRCQGGPGESRCREEGKEEQRVARYGSRGVYERR